MLSLYRLDVFLSGSHVLHGITNSFQAGVTTAVIGRNGAGKTTLARAIMGLTGPAAPKALTYMQRFRSSTPESIDISSLTIEERVSMGIGYVPQGRRIFTSLTTEQNILVGFRAARDGRENTLWTLERIYGLFPRLYERRSSAAGVLSGGEQQMLAFARALILSPDCLLLDEPTEGLSPQMMGVVADTIAAISGEGMSVILFEQNVDLIAACAQDVIALQSGEVVGEIRGKSSDELLRFATEHIQISQ
ncbi:MAG: ABC transporter ATP-binding protein [Proteobacteria bacterium]|nr:ABC transporter ATP-binding protein [Pseudomonadota bacterium]